MATRKKAETVETVETAAAITEEVATTAQVEAVAEQTTNVPQKETSVPFGLNKVDTDTFQVDQAYNKMQQAHYTAGAEYFNKVKELVELDIEARKAGLEKCLKLFQTISDTPSNDIQIRQIEQATQLYKALTNGPCY